MLLTRDVAHREEVIRLAAATAQVRDLVNTGAGDLGPAELEAEAETLARAHHAQLTVTGGDALARDYPMIHAVGQAATRERAPRLIELHWGDPAHPRIAIVGKGVCFDTGGLEIKPSAGMRLMKKDMGGAAHALALAGLVMAAKLPVRLHLLIPAVENAVSGASFRPGDVLKTRKGLTVENTNTDAEGRLILGDALSRAGEEKPELILDFATLTGAARVALGPDLPPLFTDDEALAADLLAAASTEDDPVWRMPLWDGYDEMLKSDIADMVNAPDGGFAGAITAALFLRRFVPKDTAWAHLDVFAWRPSSKPGRPRGRRLCPSRSVCDVEGAVYGGLRRGFSMAFDYAQAKRGWELYPTAVHAERSRSARPDLAPRSQPRRRLDDRHELRGGQAGPADQRAVDILDRQQRRGILPVTEPPYKIRTPSAASPISIRSLARAIAWMLAISSTVGVRPVPIAQRGS